MPFKLGFVGGAPDSAVGYAHFVAAQMDGLWRLEAGCFSNSTTTNKEAAKRYNVSQERTYNTIDELLHYERHSLDAVAILTPTPLHSEMVIQCLEQGMPVICEKALASRTEDAARITDLWQKKNGFLTVTYNYSGYPMVRELRHLVETGNLGHICHIQAEMPQEGFLRTDKDGNPPTPQTWRLNDGELPTLHLDLAVHLHELIHYLTSLSPLEVIGDHASYGHFGVVDYASYLSRYTEDVRVQFHFTKSSLGARNGLRLFLAGTKGSAEWIQTNPEELNLAYADGRREIMDRASNATVASQPRYNRFKPGHPAGFNEALANLYWDIHTALAHYQECGIQTSREVFGPTLAKDGLNFIDAMARSARTSTWQQV